MPKRYSRPINSKKDEITWQKLSKTLQFELLPVKSHSTVASLTYPKMLEFLNNANSRVLVIPPLNDGSPRRGCEDPHCPSVRVEVTPIIPTVR
ncbi:hypothetical protein D917_09493, partial [Trichinella nativa]